MTDSSNQTFAVKPSCKVSFSFKFFDLGKLIGFTELGETNQELARLESTLKDEEPSSTNLASHILTVMARGILSRFNYPIGYFSTKTADADQLFNIIWDGVGSMEMSGIKVMAFISDGASQNRKFYSMHRLADSSNVSPEGCVYWCPNRYDITRKIYFFSDPPHLMKTIRNNLEKSSIDGTRSLMVFFHLNLLNFSNLFLSSH